MAGVSTSVYKFDSVVRGQLKMYVLLLIEETHSVSWEDNNNMMSTL